MRVHWPVRAAALAIIVAISVMVSACSSGAAPASIASNTGMVALPAGTACQAVQVGPIVRCENFYTAYWPTISANLKKLYHQALKTDGGNLVIWDWYALSPA